MTKQQKAYFNLNLGWGEILLSLWVIIFNVFPAAADDRLRQQANYDVYAGGFHVLDATLDLDFREDDRYRLVLGAETQGFIGKVAKWDGTFETVGWYDAKTRIASPQTHITSAAWKNETETKEYYYNRDGTFKEFRVSDLHNDRDLRETDPALSNNTTDVMTASLEMMNSFPKDGRCEGESEIFDGKRRFKMIFQHDGNVTLKKSRYNIYAGPAVKCVVMVEPMGGQWHKKPRGWMSIQEQGRENGKMPTIWMANLADGQPAVPVKVMVRSNYGALVMHMTRYENGHDVILAEKQSN